MEICAYCEAIKKASDGSVMLDSLEALDNEGMPVAREIADLLYQAVWTIDDEVYSPSKRRSGHLSRIMGCGFSCRSTVFSALGF